MHLHSYSKCGRACKTLLFSLRLCWRDFPLQYPRSSCCVVKSPKPFPRHPERDLLIRRGKTPEILITVASSSQTRENHASLMCQHSPTQPLPSLNPLINFLLIAKLSRSSPLSTRPTRTALTSLPSSPHTLLQGIH